VRRDPSAHPVLLQLEHRLLDRRFLAGRQFSLRPAAGRFLKPRQAVFLEPLHPVLDGAFAHLQGVSNGRVGLAVFEVGHAHKTDPVARVGVCFRQGFKVMRLKTRGQVSWTCDGGLQF